MTNDTKLVLLFFALLLLLLCAGCSGEPFRQSTVNRLQVGQTPQQVRDILGTPTNVESLSTATGSTYYWSYWDNCNRNIKVDFRNNIVESVSTKNVIQDEQKAEKP